MSLFRLRQSLSRIAAIVAVLGVMVTMTLRSAEAQTAPIFIGPTCTFAWDANTETDLAGYRAWAVRGSTALPIVMITKTATSHPTSVSCAALGVTTDGVYRFNVVAVDLAGNASDPSFLDATRDTIRPGSPGNLRLTSAQPVAMNVTPNPLERQATVSWVPGTCQEEFVVSRLVSGRWIEVGRTHDTWIEVPLLNQVNQPYGVTGVCAAG